MLNRTFRCFSKDRLGVAAIDFAVIGGMVLTLILGFIDVGLLLFNDANLHGTAQRAARALRIARQESPGEQAAAFRSELCNRLIIIDCNNVEVDVRVFPDLASVGEFAEIKQGSIANPRFDVVVPSGLIFVTTLHRHQLFTPIGIILASGVPSNKMQQLQVASVFTMAEQ